MPRKTSLNVEYNTEILWLNRYFKRSTSNPRYSCLEQMIIDRKEELFHPYFETDINKGFKTNKRVTTEALRRLELEEGDTLLRKYQTWLKVIDKHIKTSDKGMVNLIKDVYINKYTTLEVAANKHLHYSRSVAYLKVGDWLEELNTAFFNAR